MSSVFEKREDAQRGQATVEAAFALPVLVLLVLLLVQPAIILYDRIAMESAAAEGCRVLATLSDQDTALCEDYILRRLSSVPQTDIFHVHSDPCSWDIRFSGDESSRSTEVTIGNKLRPLPLLDIGMKLAGMLDEAGYLGIEVKVMESIQPDWVSGTPKDGIKKWV